MRMGVLSFVVLSMAGCASGPSSMSSMSSMPSTPSTTGAEAAVRAATQQWATAFNACKAASTMGALYAPNAQLWGTVAPTLVTTPEGVNQYFAGPCTASPKPTVELGPFAAQGDGDTGLSAGTYTFTLYPGGQPRAVVARFSLAFRRFGERWLIVSHHSSPQPASQSAPTSAPAAAPAPGASIR